jgi:hypothetical protein
VNYGVPKLNGLTVSLMEILESGTPFGPNNLNNSSANGVDASRYVTNPGYLTPPDGSTTNYFFTVDCSNVPAAVTSAGFGCANGHQRDAFRLVGQKRADLAINYAHRVNTGRRSVELYVRATIINVFAQSQLCGCGGTIFENGGFVAQTRIDQTVRTNVSNSALYAAFNPFTTQPVQGVNWGYGPNFGTALNRFAWTTPRTFNTTFGIRF